MDEDEVQYEEHELNTDNFLDEDGSLLDIPEMFPNGIPQEVIAWLWPSVKEQSIAYGLEDSVTFKENRIRAAYNSKKSDKIEGSPEVAFLLAVYHLGEEGNEKCQLPVHEIIGWKNSKRKDSEKKRRKYFNSMEASQREVLTKGELWDDAAIDKAHIAARKEHGIPTGTARTYKHKYKKDLIKK
ncbi:hypothetical protein M3P05_17855 [Sansalvadorimonas sp. 2012CJ34-2]|uniref:Uncharacterized protein n=1 Tax=Parendozoicomonas callyspongiae TaxID=2942213 RepID=A0ABT0PK70_9GAMM|nr:hypothetical protein [Sansalvadorimonas sp. 2012CJ34-2]MCL6271787.1 hypothetical protein [Sansalvadorimonas sp. 2012CJ34-2]